VELKTLLHSFIIYGFNERTIISKTRSPELFERMNTMTIEEAIQASLQYENRVVDVYADAMDQVHDPVGKKIFKVLAEEEAQHVQYLEAKLEEWKRTGHVTFETVSTAIPSKDTIETAAKALQTKIAPSVRESELQLLRKALQVEIETSSFYQQMVRELADEGKNLFRRFVEIEEGHTAIVQAQIDSIIGTGSWFGITEWDPSAG
jgi:rubrerythrin